MIKVLVLCQRRAGYGGDYYDVHKTNHTINTIICKYLNVSPEHLEVSYMRGGPKDQTDKVDYQIMFDDNAETYEFIEQYKNYYDVIFLNTCPLPGMAYTAKILKEIITENGTIFIGAVTENRIAELHYNRVVFVGILSKNGFKEKQKEWTSEDMIFQRIKVYSLSDNPPPPTLSVDLSRYNKFNILLLYSSKLSVTKEVKTLMKAYVIGLLGSLHMVDIKYRNVIFSYGKIEEPPPHTEYDIILLNIFSEDEINTIIQSVSEIIDRNGILIIGSIKSSEDAESIKINKNNRLFNRFFMELNPGIEPTAYILKEQTEGPTIHDDLSINEGPIIRDDLSIRECPSITEGLSIGEARGRIRRRRRTSKRYSKKNYRRYSKKHYRRKSSRAKPRRR